MKRLLLLPLVAFALALAPKLPAAEVKIEDATIADLQVAFKKGTLTAEKLTELYLARIAAYDKQGPAINAVITLNPKALAEAKALDAERKAGKVRGPLHGIPIVLKDNYDTYDLPTTAGSQLLAGSIPPDDAYVVKKLRDAGVIILAKVNLSEWAGGGGSTSGAPPELVKIGTVPNGFSSMGLQTHNPHDLSRGPAGSSGGTGASIASGFAQFGMGTDTGGSIRGPSSSNGIVGLKPTHGLLSRDGIVPLALTFDTGGPMARSVYDIAIALSVMTGVDPADAATKKSAGKFEKDYTKFLKTGSLKGARIGVARDFMGKDPEVDRVIEEAIATLKKLGAVVVDPIKFPSYLLQSKQQLSSLIMNAEFKAQITEYLKTTKPGYPKSFDELVAKSNDPKTGYRSPEKAVGLKYSASVALDLDDPVYLAAKNEGLAATTAIVQGLFSKHHLDAIVYPTSPRPATPIKPTGTPAPADSPTNIANQTGFPDLIVPAGMTKEGLPVTISFFGPAWSEPKLLGYGFDFEQATGARALPKNTPVLAEDTITY
jgi:amidase